MAGDSEHFRAVFGSPRPVHSDDRYSLRYPVPKLRYEMGGSQASLDHCCWFNKKLSRLPTKDNEKAVLSQLLSIETFSLGR